MTDEILTESENRTLDFIKEFESASGEADRGLVITSAAHAEIYLEKILRAFLIEDGSADDLFEGPFAPFGAFSGKIKAAYVLGLITKEERDEFDAMRKVRNVFAHELDASFEHSDVKKQCAKKPIFDGRLCDRDAFMHLAMNAVVHVMHRDLMVRDRWKREVLTRDRVNQINDERREAAKAAK